MTSPRSLGAHPHVDRRESDNLLMFSTKKDAFKNSLTEEEIDETANDVKLNSRRKKRLEKVKANCHHRRLKVNWQRRGREMRHRGTTRTRSHTREWFCECCLVSPAWICWDLIQPELRRLPEVTCHWFSRLAQLLQLFD